VRDASHARTILGLRLDAALRIVAGFLFLCHGAQKFGLIQDERPIPPLGARAEATEQQARPNQPVGPDVEAAGTRAATTWIEQLRLPVGRTLVAGVIELLGGAFMMVGLLTSWVAFVASGLMAFAYFLAHAPQGFYPLFNRGEPAALFCFILALSGDSSTRALRTRQCVVQITSQRSSNT
jgi:uncharacterized membrane protein YphA (DoxX/SURF4 family)